MGASRVDHECAMWVCPEVVPRECHMFAPDGRTVWRFIGESWTLLKSVAYFHVGVLHVSLVTKALRVYWTHMLLPAECLG